MTVSLWCALHVTPTRTRGSLLPLTPPSLLTLAPLEIREATWASLVRQTLSSATLINQYVLWILISVCIISNPRPSTDGCMYSSYIHVVFPCTAGTHPMSSLNTTPNPRGEPTTTVWLTSSFSTQNIIITYFHHTYMYYWVTSVFTYKPV